MHASMIKDQCQLRWRHRYASWIKPRFKVTITNRFEGVESDIPLTFAWIELSALSDTSICPKALKELIHHIAADASIKHVLNHDWVSSNDE